MSSRTDEFGAGAQRCSTCGNPRGAEVEIGGRGARGCPACGASLSPIVGVKKEDGENHGVLKVVGRITNNGRPVLGSDNRVETGSVVYQRPDGTHGASVVDWDQERYEGSAKTPLAAARAAHQKLAEAHGKVFKVRGPAERKAINDTAKNLGYGNEWDRY